MPTRRRPAPDGELATYEKETFRHGGFTHDVYRKGRGPAVIVIAEMPGISPQVLGFADLVADLGCTAVLPNLFGTAGRDPLRGGVLSKARSVRTMLGAACISREFTAFATGRASPIVTFLRALARAEHARSGGPGVGVVGMCFTGGFALAMAVEPAVVAPVLSQPSLPAPLGRAHARASIDCSAEDLETIAARCQNEGMTVLGLRFNGDPFVPRERFAFLRERLGDAFVAIELAPRDRHPEGPLPFAHSVLTGDLIDEPGEPTHDARGEVLALFRRTLLKRGA